MAAKEERILVVEDDPDARDLIQRQALQPLGYEVKAVGTASEAIQQALKSSPDLLIASLNLPDLSGKDLLVALNSQGLEIPTILIADKGAEGDVIQSLRLGATDYLTRPIREAELVSAVERALKQVRASKERESLASQLKKTNEELQQRVRELTTIFAIGKAVTSITDQSTLFDRIVEGAVYVTVAQRGWLLIHDEDLNAFILRAYRNLPRSLEMKLNQPWDDGISSLVAISGEPLSMHGAPLKRFKVAQLGQAALVVPIKIHKENIGILVVVRKAARPFSQSDQVMLEAVADYASISLVNARLFRALEARARSLQGTMEQARRSEKTKDELIRKLSEELRRPLVAAQGYVQMLREGQLGDLRGEQQEAVQVASDNLDRLLEIIERMGAMDRVPAPEHLKPADLNSLARQAINRFQRTAQQAGLALMTELPSETIYAYADPEQLNQVFDGLLTNAIKFCPRGGQISLRIERSDENTAHVVVRDTGIGIQKHHLTTIFDGDFQKSEPSPNPIREKGARLAMIKDIILAHGGRVWAESWPREGSAFHFTLLSSE